MDKCSSAVPIREKKKKKENIPKLCDLTLKYDQTCLRRLCLVESPQPMNEVLPSPRDLSRKSSSLPRLEQ